MAKEKKIIVGIDEVGRAAKSEPRRTVSRVAKKTNLAKPKYIIGIDEVGRGPLAGPVTVGAVAITVNPKSEIRNPKQIQNPKILKNIKDSKKLNARKRNEWNKILRKNFECHYASVNNKTIDKIGIQKAILLSVRMVLNKFSEMPDLVLLDGLLKAPKHYNQRTIIKGDEKIPVISAASIIAKVARDRKMAKLPKKFAKYGFEKHKGYGTKEHYKMIKKHGVSKIHRKSYLKKPRGVAKKCK
ncbi:MAG: ribonuclease HII [bacterium]|nr:ribonuclease HII [bacterium]